MTYEHFTWCPMKDPEGTSTFRVHSVQFGDGFAQEVGDGINSETRSWPLEFSGRESEVKPIRDFLRRHGGFRPFLWTPPMESSESLFVVQEMKLRPKGGGTFVLVATFIERFSP